MIHDRRVAEVEKKLDDLRILLQPPQQELQRPKHNAVDDSSYAASTAATPDPRSVYGTHPYGQTAVDVLSENCRIHKHRDQDVIDKEVLSEKEATQLLQVYLTTSQGFPFIYIDQLKSLDTLRDEQPFLLLAILTASSQRSQALQVLLEKEFRETLASKVIIEGELSLDVLQGLMLYLAWYHYNFRPARQQIYQLTQLCGSMIVDLELHKPAERGPGFVMHPSKACMACKKDTAPPIASEAEALRTFVGAYYLTASICIMLRKPNGMVYTSYIEQCCKKLAELSRAPTDAYLIHYIRLTRIAEEISTTFGYCAAEVDLHSSHHRIQGTVQSFVTKAQDLEEEIPLEIRKIPSIMFLLYTIPNLAHEIIFHLDARAGSSPALGFSAQEDNWQSSSIRTDMFLALVDSVHKSLDWSVTLPLDAFEGFNLLDISRISYHLLLLSRLVLSGYPGSEKAFPSEVSKLSSYYEAILGKYQQLGLLQNQNERSSIYSHLHDVLEASKNWTMRNVAERMANGEKHDYMATARIHPRFHIVSPWGVIDLEKDRVEVLSNGYTVAAATNWKPGGDDMVH